KLAQLLHVHGIYQSASIKSVELDSVSIRREWGEVRIGSGSDGVFSAGDLLVRPVEMVATLSSDSVAIFGPEAQHIALSLRLTGPTFYFLAAPLRIWKSHQSLALVPDLTIGANSYQSFGLSHTEPLPATIFLLSFSRDGVSSAAQCIKPGWS